MNIEDLRTSISTMSDNELIMALKDIRANRRTNKRPQVEAKVKSSKAELDLSKIVGGMSEEDKAMMIAMLEDL